MKNLLLIMFFLSNLLPIAHSVDLRTTGEKTNWKKTGRAIESEKLCKLFEKEFPSQVACRSFGMTPEGRNLRYLVVGNLKHPIVWVQGGIHAGEIDGKDAVYLLMKEILQGKIKPNPLKEICLVFIPIFNLDGHERFEKYNRPNQIGPEEMGWRTTSQNLNLNRDFMKADAPEMRALLKLWQKIDPVLSLDLHVTDGAQFQPEVGLIILPHNNQVGQHFENELLKKMKNRGRLALPFYPSFENEDDPMSGFGRYVSLSRFSHGYWSTNNRLGMLVETHSWKDYATRVKSHYDTVLSSLEIAQTNGRNWKKLQKEMDGISLAGKEVEIEFKHNEIFSTIEFPGYEYSINKSTISGEKVIKYDPSRPAIWKVPFYEEIKATLIVEAPIEGYFIQPSDADWLLPKLKVHNIQFNKWTKSLPSKLKVYRAAKTQFSIASFEGHQTLIVQGEWKEEVVKLPKEPFFIPVNQPKAKLILQLFEPRSQDSFLAWGFFNRAFERKEYMENYVAEDVANEMLKSPEIKSEFEQKLKLDPEFARSPEQRFEFFYRKHPSWDERFNKYPVYKK